MNLWWKWWILCRRWGNIFCAVLSPQRHRRRNKRWAVRVRSSTPWEWGGVGKREMVVASHLEKTVGWGRSLTWADWVHVTNVVSRWLDSGFEVAWSDVVTQTLYFPLVCGFTVVWFWFLSLYHWRVCFFSLDYFLTSSTLHTTATYVLFIDGGK